MSRADALIKTALASLARKQAKVSKVFCSREDYHDVRDYQRRIGVDTTGRIGVLTPHGRVPLRVDETLETNEYRFCVRFDPEYLSNFTEAP